MSAVPAKISSNAFSLDERYSRERGVVYMTGVQALVRTVLDRARLDQRMGRSVGTFVSGYEGSPLGGYDLELARRRKLLEELHIVHQPGLNEEIAATSIMGSQLAATVGRLRFDGVAGVWYGKSPGLDRAADAIRHGNLAGASSKGGAVLFVGDDPGAKSSGYASASERSLADLAVPTLYPADTQDVLDFGLHAQMMSRYSGLWTALKIVTPVADGASTAYVDPDRIGTELETWGTSTHRPNAKLIGGQYVLDMERSLHEVRLPRALEYARYGGLNRLMFNRTDSRIGIVAAGKTYLDLREALEHLGLPEAELSGLGIRLLKLGMIYPIDPDLVRQFANGLSEIIVVEEKRAFVEVAIKDVLYTDRNAPPIFGKRGPDGNVLFGELGELSATSIAASLTSVLERHRITVRPLTPPASPNKGTLPLLVRTPYMCSGCPHSSSTKVADGALVGAGTGCHAMVMLMEPKRVGSVIGLTVMGGEGTQWLGMAPFLEEQHFIQNLGDGTFLHSGSLAVRAAVASGANITYKLLFNSAVAMTGGQRPVGERSVERIAQLLVTEGVNRVVITADDPRRIDSKALPPGVSVHGRDELASLQHQLSATRGVTVLIHDQECAAEKRRSRKRGRSAAPTQRIFINQRACEGCGDCGETSNCLSVQPVQTEFGRKTQILQSSCNQDYSCLNGDCPSLVTVSPGKAASRQSKRALEAHELPAPPLPVKRECAIRITGIGGTGVVTVSQILAVAAVLDGLSVRTVDQTGLAQKGGAVISDIKIAAGPSEQSGTIGDGRCDLYLGFDALVATDPKNLRVMNAKDTTAVVSMTEVPTGAMVTNSKIAFPEWSAIRDRIDIACREAHYVDAGGVSSTIFDDEQYANMVLIGVTLQRGLLPISAESLEKAIELNGVDVLENVQALRRGRQTVINEGEVRGESEEEVQPPRRFTSSAEAVSRIVGLPESSSALDLVRNRADELIRYQDIAYAKDYVAFVEQVRQAETAALPGSTEFTAAVAQYLYKVMAYKDEYEVARLFLNPEFDAAVTEEFGAGSSYRYHFQPQFLRHLGVKKKIAVGTWFRPVLRALYAMRRLRGGRFDLFGHTDVRKEERKLPAEYRRMIDSVLPKLRRETLDAALRIARLPDQIRGYEDIKLRSLGRYRDAASDLMVELEALGQGVDTMRPVLPTAA